MIIVKALNFKNVSLKASVKANLSARSRNTCEKIREGMGGLFCEKTRENHRKQVHQGHVEIDPLEM